MAEVKLTHQKRGIPSLDGWRAISVLLVIGLHSLQSAALHPNKPVISALFIIFNGALGVRIFFVISGYLITRLLLKEQQQTGNIALGKFYLRRAFRILPPLYLYIAFVAVLVALGKLVIPGGYLLLAALFCSTYVDIPASVTWWPLEHTWSLCSEEQFYLLWPALLVWAMRSRDPKLRQKRASAIALAGIILIPLVRIVWSMKPYGPLHPLGNTVLTLDVILFGVLAAVAEGHETFERFYKWGTRSPLLLGILLWFGSGFLEAHYPGKYMKSIGSSINGVLILLLLLWTVRESQTAFARLLNWQPLAWIGVLSYSLYLWQTFFLHESNAGIFHLTHHLPLPLGLLGIALCGTGSFFLVERPSLLLRDRLMRRTSPV